MEILHLLVLNNRWLRYLNRGLKVKIFWDKRFCEIDSQEKKVLKTNP